jgi:hypothetical protein
MNVHWRMLIKNNREGKRRIHLIVKRANHSKIEIEKEQPSFKKLWDYMEKMHIHNTKVAGFNERCRVS